MPLSRSRRGRSVNYEGSASTGRPEIEYPVSTPCLEKRSLNVMVPSLFREARKQVTPRVDPFRTHHLLCPALTSHYKQFGLLALSELDGDTSPIVPHEDSWAYKIVESAVILDYDSKLLRKRLSRCCHVGNRPEFRRYGGKWSGSVSAGHQADFCGVATTLQLR